MANAAKPRKRPPLVVCEHPKEVGPPGGLEVNDLRVFLLEVAGESPRLRQDGGIFVKDEPRFLDALPPRSRLDRRGPGVTRRAPASPGLLARQDPEFVEVEDDDKTSWLRLSGKGRNWLAAGFEEQYARIYEYYRVDSEEERYPTSIMTTTLIRSATRSSSASRSRSARSRRVPRPIIPTTKTSSPSSGMRSGASIYKAFQALPVGVFHRWDSVLDHSCFGEHNPLTRGQDPSKLTINIDRRQVPRLPEQIELAGKLVLDALPQAPPAALRRGPGGDRRRGEALHRPAPSARRLLRPPLQGGRGRVARRRPG